jgi:oligopeptide/dipeptide ABC transporter ATP-binding protein
MNEAVLSVRDLSVSFSTLRGRINVIDRLSLEIAPGEILGMVGESGSGKSVTALAIMRLLGPSGAIDQGSVSLLGKNLASCTEEDMLKVRGVDVAMIFQEPMTSLNPVFSVGFQIAEPLMEHLGYSKKRAMNEAVRLMEQVGIPEARARSSEYPHQMSGGMRQRVMIAMGLACRPKLLIADEPTTALDVTIQAQILRLLLSLRDEMHMGILLITHDMGVIAEMVDRVMVMYAGQLVEKGPVKDLFADPRHPYTRLLLQSIPQVHTKKDRLPTIQGVVSVPSHYPSGCRFHPRCPLAVPACEETPPPLEEIGKGRMVRCIRAAETALLAEKWGGKGR